VCLTKGVLRRRTDSPSSSRTLPACDFSARPTDSKRKGQTYVEGKCLTGWETELRQTALGPNWTGLSQSGTSSFVFAAADGDVWQGFALALIPALVVSVVSAVVTVRLAIRQFYSQRWWERRAETYTAIVESLSRMADCLRAFMDYEMAGPYSREKDDLKELWSEFRTARRAIQRFTWQSSFIVSESVAADLQKVTTELEKEYYPNDPPLTELEAYSEAVRVALEAIIPHARADLSV
jgi:hypothetical protein